MTHQNPAVDGPAATLQRRRAAVIRPAAVAVALVALVSLVLTVFLWPTVRTAPRHVPLGLVASAERAAQVSATLEAANPGAFRLVPYADEDAARDAIADREVYGAIVEGPTVATVLTAPAASPAVATALDALAQGMNAALLERSGAEVPVAVRSEVAVAGSSADPRGTGFPSLIFPLVLGSLVIGVISGVVLRAGVLTRVLVATGASVGAGLAAAGIAGGWLGVIPGAFWATSGIIALTLLASSLSIVAMTRLMGPRGIAVMAPILLLLGNPLSAAASAPELLPGGWAGLGQALPAGALVRALRSVVFFDGAGVGRPVGVLLAWICGGAVVLVGAVLLRRPGRVTAQTAAKGGRDSVELAAGQSV